MANRPYEAVIVENFIHQVGDERVRLPSLTTNHGLYSFVALRHHQNKLCISLEDMISYIGPMVNLFSSFLVVLVLEKRKRMIDQR
jgi:hypothetical protein